MGKLEVIDILEDQMSTVAFKGFLRGNILKYLMRHEYKGGLEDLRKAQWYISKLVELEART